MRDLIQPILFEKHTIYHPNSGISAIPEGIPPVIKKLRKMHS
jgi:hypothetical protein